jgi:hypothetical protein
MAENLDMANKSRSIRKGDALRCMATNEEIIELRPTMNELLFEFIR